jgi:thiol-disulfide isomerase/thioredoxin
MIFILATLCSQASIDPPSKSGAQAPNWAVHGTTAALTWIEPDGDGHAVKIAMLAGSKWSAPKLVVRSAKLVANWADFPSAAIEGRDILVHFAEKSGEDKYAYGVELARSIGGAPFERLGPAHDDRTPTEHGFASLVPEHDGFRLFWLDGRNMVKPDGPMTIRSARLSARGIEDPHVLDDRVCECCGTSASITSEGPFIVYRDRSEAEIRNISIVRKTASGWSSPRAIHDDQWKVPGCPVNGPASDAVAKRAVVAWYTGAELGRIRVAFSDDAAATFGKPHEIHDVPDAAPLGRVDVALVDDGAIVCWLVADDEKNARILYRHVDTDGRVGRPHLLALTSPERGSGFPRMAKVGDALLFAWTEVGPPSKIRARRAPIATIDRGRERAVATSPIVGKKTPRYSARSLDGKPVSLSELKGRVVLLNVWATWCGPCRNEMPELAKLHQRHERAGLSVIGISVDEAGADTRVRDVVSKLALPYPIWRDPEDRASRVFDGAALPVTVIVDRSGKIAFHQVGVVPIDQLERIVESLLIAR